MSKSYGNTLGLTELPDAIRATVQKMFTDPKRIKRTDPGHPEVCNVCGYWKMFAPDRAATVWEGCRTATRGCAQNKEELAEVLIQLLEPFRQGARRSEDEVERLLADGARRARAVAQETIREVKMRFGLAGTGATAVKR